MTVSVRMDPLQQRELEAAAKRWLLAYTWPCLAYGHASDIL